MSKYSEFIKTVKKDDKQRFFGETHEISNKYFTFNHVIDNDNIIVVTANVKIIKDSFVLIVDNDSAVFLKNWQVKKVRNYDLGIYAYAVKLNRNFFKPYKFKSDFEDMSFEEADTFDSLLEVAKTQNLKIALGW